MAKTPRNQAESLTRSTLREALACEPAPVAKEDLATCFGVIRRDDGGYYVVQADIPIDDARVVVTHRSRLSRAVAFEQLTVLARANVFPVVKRPSNG